MNDKYIVSKINEYLHQSKRLLITWLENVLPRVTDNWWNECVLEKLSYSQRELTVKKDFHTLSDFDLSILLRIVDKNWYDIRNFEYLPTNERECIRNMQGVCNHWAYGAGR